MKTTILRWPIAALLAFAGLGASRMPVRRGPEDIGQWGPVKTNIPIVAIHSTLLPNGKVIFWDRNSDAGAPGGPGSVIPGPTTPRLWDPVADPDMDGPFATSAYPGHELFCSGHVQLRDGRLFVAGGHNGADGEGLQTAYIYDPNSGPTGTWTVQPLMAFGRWYPTVTLLSTGDVCVVTGSIHAGGPNNNTPQVFLAGTGVWKDLTGAVKDIDLYPMMHLAPNGMVFRCGWDSHSEYLDTDYVDTKGTPSTADDTYGRWIPVANTVFGDRRDYGSSVLYDTGKVLLMGGGTPTNSAEIIDLTAPTPAWQPTTPMIVGRRQMNALILADGRVLVTGGTTGTGFNNHNGVVLDSEIWDPATGGWTLGAPMQKERIYHSETVLLMDGRVLSIGSGHPAGANGGVDQYNAEIYSPSYLFKPRPTITSAPASAAHGQTFHVKTPSPGSISKAHLIRLSSVTHSFNMEQRICRLTPAASGTGVDVTVPASTAVCPPGYYQLILVDSAGVPSTAKMIRIDANGNTPPIANAGGASSVEAVSPLGTTVVVDGSGSTDPGGAVVEYQWYEGTTLLGTFTTPTGMVSLSGVGMHTLRLRVLDALGLFSESTVAVTLTDTTAPSIQTLSATPFLLRPADGTIVAVPVTATATDNADAAPTLSILSITSSEADAGVVAGDLPGDTGGVGTLTAQLRAERWSLRRIYTIRVEARDASGNTSTGDIQVEVRSKWFP